MISIKLPMELFIIVEDEAWFVTFSVYLNVPWGSLASDYANYDKKISNVYDQKKNGSKGLKHSIRNKNMLNTPCY